MLFFSEYLINIFYRGRKNILVKCWLPCKVEKGKEKEGLLYFSLKTQTFSYNSSHHALVSLTNLEDLKSINKKRA